MEREADIVESLLRSAGRRTKPPEDAYSAVFDKAHAAFRNKASRRQQRQWLSGAAAAAAVVLAVVLTLRGTPPVAQRAELARVARIVGTVEVATGEAWGALTEASVPLAPGTRLRTHADGRAAIALAGGESLRLAGDTEVMLDAPARLYLRGGTIYVDSGAPLPRAHLEVVTPAGTARDLGTQFELHVAGAALRLRVREGMVALERGGQFADRAGRASRFRSTGRRSRARANSARRSRPGSGRKPSRPFRTWTACRPRR